MSLHGRYYRIAGFNDSPVPEYDPSPCPCCGGFRPLPENFWPYNRSCPKCGIVQMISAYNVSVTCINCSFTGMRDEFIWPPLADLEDN